MVVPLLGAVTDVMVSSSIISVKDYDTHVRNILKQLELSCLKTRGRD